MNIRIPDTNSKAASIGGRFRALRKALGWTQGEAAAALGFARYQTISGYERGGEIPASTLHHLASHFEGGEAVLEWLRTGQPPVRLIPRTIGATAVSEPAIPYYGAVVSGPEAAVRVGALARAMAHIMAYGESVPRIVALQVLDEISTAWAGEEARRSGGRDDQGGSQFDDGRQRSQG